ncbi:hypothetical protein [Parvibaculum sp.]|uniref:hypothetical protein n=1 Tax=Parvibaculum sp. TaxID=2024848 RepID=UPI0034A0675E
MFFITWTGKGYVTFLLLIGAIFVVAALYVYGTMMLPDNVFGDTDSADENVWYLFSFYMLFMGLVTLPLGRIFLKEPLREIVYDRKTGTRNVIVTEHTVLDVNVRYHAWIFFGVGAICLVFGLLETAGILKTGIEQYLQAR